MPKQRIYKYYQSVVAEDFLILFNYDNIMQLPKLQYGVVSNSDSDYLINKKQGISAFAALSLVTGQKSISTRAHKSIAAFKLREKSFIGCKVTVRKNVLFVLLDQLISFVFVYTQNYGMSITASNTKNPSLNVGVHKVVALPALEKFFIFFESLKGCNLCFVLSCPVLKSGLFTCNAQPQVFSLPAFFLRCFQIPCC